MCKTIRTENNDTENIAAVTEHPTMKKGFMTLDPTLGIRNIFQFVGTGRNTNIWDIHHVLICVHVTISRLTLWNPDDHHRPEHSYKYSKLYFTWNPYRNLLYSLTKPNSCANQREYRKGWPSISFSGFFLIVAWIGICRSRHRAGTVNTGVLSINLESVPENVNKEFRGLWPLYWSSIHVVYISELHTVHVVPWY